MSLLAIMPKSSAIRSVLSSRFWLLLTAPASYALACTLSTHTEVTFVARSSELGVSTIFALPDRVAVLVELLLEAREFFIWFSGLLLLSVLFRSSRYVATNITLFLVGAGALILASLTEFTIEREVTFDLKECYCYTFGLYWLFGVLPFFFNTIGNPANKVKKQ